VHLKAFLLPFFSKKHPEEIIHSFDEINPKVKQLILRKGLINIIPTFLKNELITNYK
jgi:hypothetical protein